MDDDEIEVPCHFLCPISMEVMRDPVTVVSGITYDRVSIERWLSSSVKNKKTTTCPVTKQDLADAPTLTPNHTLRRLIHSWCAHHGVDISERTPDPSPTPQPVAHGQPRVLELLRDAAASPAPELAMRLRRLRGALSLGNERNRKCLEESGAVEFLASVIKRRGFAACSAEVQAEDSAADVALSLLYHVQASAALLRGLAGESGEMMESLLHALTHGKDQTRAYAVLLMWSLLEAADPVRPAGATHEVFSEVVRVLRDRISLKATKAALKVLVMASRWGRNRVKAVEAGAVHALVEVLLGGACGSAEWRSCELALAGLDQLCSCAEGRAELLRHGAGVAVVSKKMLRVSEVATDRAVRVVSWICRLSATGRVLQEMLEVGAVAKLCLVLQVENGLKTKERSREILRLHAKAWRASPCITPHLLSTYPPS